MHKTHLITRYYVASIFVKGKYYRPLSNLEKSSDWNNFWHKNTLLQNKQNGIVCIPIYRKNFFTIPMWTTLLQVLVLLLLICFQFSADFISAEVFLSVLMHECICVNTVELHKAERSTKSETLSQQPLQRVRPRCRGLWHNLQTVSSQIGICRRATDQRCHCQHAVTQYVFFFMLGLLL